MLKKFLSIKLLPNLFYSKYKVLSTVSYTLNSTRIMTEENSISGISLSEILKELNSFADLSLAEKWDNVGLLIGPFTETTIKNVLLTNDLTEDVMMEAIDRKTNLIISYHPPIFAALKRITKSSWKERIVAACLENKIAVFSPHTSWDAVHGGVNDWLAEAFGTYISPNGIFPITPCRPIEPQYLTSLIASPNVIDELKSNNPNLLLLERSQNAGKQLCTILSRNEDIKVIKSLAETSAVHHEIKEVNQLCGMGRLINVSGLTIEKCVGLVKKQTDLPFVRLALSRNANKGSEVKTIALCAGSGGSLLKGVKADLYVTGEMLHHDILEANHNGASVILTNHSDSERGFLKKMANILQGIFKERVNILISRKDSDPLKTV